MFDAARLNSVGYLLCVSILEYITNKNATANARVKCCKEKRAEITMFRQVGVSDF